MYIDEAKTAYVHLYNTSWLYCYRPGIIPIALGHGLTTRPEACRSVLLHAMAVHDFTGVESGQLSGQWV